MTLERIEIPLPPSYQQLAEAILAFHAEFYAMNWADYSGPPADLGLLALAERLRRARHQPHKKDLPSTRSLTRSAPDFTGRKTLQEHMDWIRGRGLPGAPGVDSDGVEA